MVNHKRMVIRALEIHKKISLQKIEYMLPLDKYDVRNLLNEMLQNKIIKTTSNSNLIYVLKRKYKK